MCKELIVLAEEIKNDDYNPQILSLTNDDGQEYTFEVLDDLETETGYYLALLPVFENKAEFLEDSGELVIVKVTEENGEEFYYEIEDDDEYETVADAFVDRLENYFEINEED